MAIAFLGAKNAVVCGAHWSPNNNVHYLLFGMILGCILTLLAIRLWGREFKPYESSPTDSCYTSVSSENSTDSPIGFGIDVTSGVLDALKDHLQNIDTEQERESLGRIHISYKPSVSDDNQTDLLSVLRRWSLPTVPAPDAINQVDTTQRGHNSAETNPKWRIRENQSGYDIDSSRQAAKIEIVSEEGWFSEHDDEILARQFDEQVLSKISSLEESRMYLRRTRAVSLLSSRLMAAPDEKTCYEIVSRLLVPLFHVDRISYVLMKDADNMIVKQITVNKKEHIVMGLDGGFLGDGHWDKGEVVKPLKGTAVEVCSKTLRECYCPRIKDSPFESQRQISKMGIGTILATPILVNGNKFIGCIMVCMVAEDAFKEYDRILIQDIAKQLGMTLYGIRVKHAVEKSNAISREMLHSMIPPHVIEKISCFWDTSSDEYKRRRSSSSNGLASSFSEDEDARTLLTSSRKRIRPENGVVEKVQVLSKMYHDEVPEAEIGTLVTNESEVQQLSTITKALYAENVDDVCIIFADIVGFSRISLELEPLVVVNMLQDIFSRFDQLCDMHRIQKLETIGDAFIATAGIGKDVKDSINESAARILNTAKDMVHQARHVLIPTPGGLGIDSDLLNSLEIRVGIHVGNVTCGVLGQRLPKMTVFGRAVNLAARMEQTCPPSHIRVTEDFYRLVNHADDEWKQEETELKNMGVMTTYLLNPLANEPDSR